MTQNTPENKEAQQPQPVAKRPNESGSFSVEGFVRIFDPNTQETIVEKRA